MTSSRARSAAGFGPARLLAGSTAALLLCALCSLGLGAGVAGAQAADVHVTTPYPAVDVQPGQLVTFPIAVVGSAARIVPLALADVPTGWKATLRGGGFLISGITASVDLTKPATASLEVTVPDGAAEGTYPINVLADGIVAIPLQLRVQAKLDQGVSLKADFDHLKMKPSETFAYTLTVTNNVPVEQVFSFEASGPQGWDVAAVDASQAAAATVRVAGGATASVKVTAKAPAATAGGQYPIDVTVTANDGSAGNIQLTAEVAGEAQLALTTSDQRLNLSAEAGSTTRKTLVVQNDGSAALENVSLTASAPTDWKITFDPPTVASVDPGGTAEVTALIQPSKDAVAGDYDLKVTGNAGGLHADSSLRVTVKSSRWWGVVGVALIIAAVSALFAVFRRFGRR